MPTTIREVAERAGVSVSTVSRVLNDHPFVSDSARERVLEAMEALAYLPDVAAQSMRTGTSRAVGFVVDDFANPLFSSIAKGADIALHPHGFSLVLANSHHDVRREAEAIAALRQRRVDGLLVALVDELEPSLPETLAAFRATVVLDREVPGSTADAVLPDHAAGIRAALTHLVGLGHRRIGLIAGSLHQRGSRSRVEAYRDTVRRLALPLDEALVRAGDLSGETGYLATRELLALPEPPTALVAGSNQIFVGVIAATRDLGLEIPSDLSLVTCDEVDASRLHEPPIDVIARDTLEMGRVGADLLLARLADPTGPPRRAIVPVVFGPRGSSASPPTAPRGRGPSS